MFVDGYTYLSMYPCISDYNALFIIFNANVELYNWDFTNVMLSIISSQNLIYSTFVFDING